MISTLLIDDEEKSCQILNKLLVKNCPGINVVGYAHDLDTAVKYIREKRPQLIFLDVEMEGENGFDLLRQFQPVPFKIIFVTAHLNYAIKAIRYSAADFLLKPVDSGELMEAVQRVSSVSPIGTVQLVEGLLNNLEPGAICKLAIPVKDGFIYLNTEDIVRLEADRAYTVIITTNAQYLASRNIREYEYLLPIEYFYRAHNSHLLNLHHVKKFLREDGFYALMTDGSKVEISRRKKDEFLERMAVLPGRKN